MTTDMRSSHSGRKCLCGAYYHPACPIERHRIAGEEDFKPTPAFFKLIQNTKRRVQQKVEAEYNANQQGEKS